MIYDRRQMLGILDPDPDVLDLEDPDYLAAWLAHRHQKRHEPETRAVKGPPSEAAERSEPLTARTPTTTH